MGNATSTVVINWSDVGMGLGGIIGLVLTGFLFYKYVWPMIPPGIAGAIYNFMSSLFQYSSTGLFSYGFIEFFITQQTDGLVPNIFALIGLIINKFMAGGFGGAAVAAAVAAPAVAAPPAAAAANPFLNPDLNPFREGGRKMKGGAFGPEFCSVPGLGFLADNGYSPGAVVLVTTILFHYLVTIWSNGGGVESILPSLTLAVLWGIHAFTIVKNCGPAFNIQKILVGVLIGLVLGVSSWATLKYGLKKGVTTPPKSGGLLGSKKGDSATPGVGTCSAPNDQDQFVCEAYRNGELITTTIAE